MNQAPLNPDAYDRLRSHIDGYNQDLTTSQRLLQECQAASGPLADRIRQLEAENALLRQQQATNIEASCQARIREQHTELEQLRKHNNDILGYIQQQLQQTPMPAVVAPPTPLAEPSGPPPSTALPLQPAPPSQSILSPALVPSVPPAQAIFQPQPQQPPPPTTVLPPQPTTIFPSL